MGFNGYQQALADEERAPREALGFYRRLDALERMRRPALVLVATALGALGPFAGVWLSRLMPHGAEIPVLALTTLLVSFSVPAVGGVLTETRNARAGAEWSGAQSPADSGPSLSHWLLYLVFPLLSDAIQFVVAFLITGLVLAALRAAVWAAEAVFGDGVAFSSAMSSPTRQWEVVLGSVGLALYFLKSLSGTRTVQDDGRGHWFPRRTGIGLLLNLDEVAMFAGHVTLIGAIIAIAQGISDPWVIALASGGAAIAVLARSKLVFEPPSDLAASALYELGAARCLIRLGRTASADAVLGRRFVDHDAIRPVPDELRELALVTAEAIRLHRGARLGGGSRRDVGSWRDELDELRSKAPPAWEPQLKGAFTDAVTRTKGLVRLE